MQEKVMVADTLAMINSSLGHYGEYIAQTENQQLRQTLQQIRNGDETSQYELFQLAKNKNYYTPADPASPEEISKVKTMFSQPMQ